MKNKKAQKQDIPCCRVAITGGPGGGKTTAIDLYRREIGPEVVVVPEAATILYTGGFPRAGEKSVRISTQRAIYHVQKNLEDSYAAFFSSRILLCDRGTLDGGAYWPGTLQSFLADLDTTLDAELSRYDAVLFFETAAIGGLSIEGGNPARIESLAEAIAIDKKLREIWSKHPHFIFVPHQKSFIKKIQFAMKELTKLVKKRHQSLSL